MSHSRPGFGTNDDRDPLSRMQAVQITRELLPRCWDDAEKLAGNEVTQKIAGQLYAAMTSILANLGEGYSRSSGRDRAKFFEYALGSVRETMMWYRSTERVLGRETIEARLDKLEQVRRLLLATIPRERGRLIRPKK
jgi:four helix bundle protein